MEITSAFPKPPLHAYINTFASRTCIGSIKCLLQQHTSTGQNSARLSNPPSRIQLPLQRPNRHPPKKTEITSPSSSDILRLMDSLGVPLTADVYVSLIKECTAAREASRAVELYAHIARSGASLSLGVVNRVLLMLVSCGCLDDARQVFDKMRVRNSRSWAAMIAGCVESGEFEQSLDLFVEMKREDSDGGEWDDIVANGMVICALKACVGTMNLELGKQIHGWSLKLGHGENVALNSFLIKFYGEFGCFDDADNVFYQMPSRNTVVWTAKLVNSSNEGKYEEAIDLFKEMGRVGVKKNSFTFSSVLKASGKMRDGGGCGRQLHANGIKLGLDTDDHVLCSLIDMYGKYGLVRDGRTVFDMVSDKRNVALWNAMLNGCIKHGFSAEGIKIIKEMKRAGLRPHESFVNEVLLLCGSSKRLADEIGM
ncbi:pentatricopeptide repeat-containing protein At1g31790 [Ipomoea triloba]|uniref:pentatricopeptide repeat-containing protein At1g31790 n=1 Tax=Ipomoea triloba TaxID=35885 RepID=UPI00125E89FC|nr:pentatricopeptide repeat-containing protein At1g31790 [Ipomoea triloba]